MSDFALATLKRMARTAAQYVLGVVTPGMLLTDIDWLLLVSGMGTMTLLALCNAILTGLPEAPDPGDPTITVEPHP